MNRNTLLSLRKRRNMERDENERQGLERKSAYEGRLRLDWSMHVMIE